MGVMACDRIDCESIMCDTYISSVGYICKECQDEFKQFLINENIEVRNEGEINRELEKFMVTTKSKFVHGREISVDDFFNINTR